EENEKPIIEDQNNVISPLCAVQETSENEIVVFFTQQKMSSHLSQIMKSTCNDNDEESSSSPPNQELEDTETIPPIIVNKWFIEDYNVSDGFRKYQISNIDKLVAGETFNFASSNIDDERKWRISIRQPRQQTPPSFLGEIMDEYEAEINDIDELRSKFYDMWGKYRDKVIYSDNERRLFEAIQAVAHITIYRVMKKDEKEETCKVEREETCFVEAKHLSVTRNSKIGGYNLYK
ncbi:17584_t:CDS:2, partial [Racocetra fulgida]